jgi:hypothetical protein
MDHQRIFFSSYLALLYGASLSLLTDIFIRYEYGEPQLVNILDPRIHWSTTIASCIYYIASPRIAWWVGQDEYRSTLVKWKMRGIVWIGMTCIYPLLTLCLTDIVLLSLGEKTGSFVDRVLYTPPLAILLTALCELSGVNHSIRIAYIQQNN